MSHLRKWQPIVIQFHRQKVTCICKILSHLDLFSCNTLASYSVHMCIKYLKTT